MRKSGPFRSIRLCAYTAVGADAGVVRTVIAPDDIPVETAEAVGWLASLVDRRCQTTKPSKRTQTNMRTARRPRIRFHLMGTVASQKYTDYRGCPSSISSSPEERHLWSRRHGLPLRETPMHILDLMYYLYNSSPT